MKYAGHRHADYSPTPSRYVDIDMSTTIIITMTIMMMVPRRDRRHRHHHHHHDRHHRRRLVLALVLPKIGAGDLNCSAPAGSSLDRV
jgi:hypothetical protein